MGAYIVRRLLIMIPTLFGVALLVFAMTRLASGDPARQLAGADASPQEVAEIRAELGLDRPLPVQFGSYVVSVAQGDLGRSLLTNRPVANELLSRFPTTLRITAFAMVLALIVGLPLGVIAATHRHGPVDAGATVVALVGISMPLFWTAIMGILVFSVRLQWLPVGGIHGSIFSIDGFKSYLLPCFTLALTPIALIARLTRASTLEVLNREFVVVARAKGVAERWVIARHVLRNAFLPVLTYVGLQFGFLLGGAVVTETIFALPGVGRLIITSISQRDYPMIQGAVLMIAVIFLTINLVVDVLYAWIDPRVSYA